MSAASTRGAPEGRPLLGLAAIGAVVLVLVAAATGVIRGLAPSPAQHVVHAVFATTATLQDGDPVRAAGVDVGTVKRIEPADGGRASRVAMRVDRDVALHRDARASVSWRTLLGGTFVVDLDPGTPARGPLAGADIPESRTTTQVELEDLVSFARGGSRRGLQTMPRELARGLSDTRAPARMLSALDDASPALEGGLRALRGQHSGDLARLVTATARATRALDAPTHRLDDLVAGAARTLGTTAARAADVRLTIARSPATLRHLVHTLGRLRKALRDADPLLAHLRAPAGDLGPTARGLRPTITATDGLLRDAAPLLRALPPGLRALRDASGGTHGLLDALSPAIGRLADEILPFLDEVDPRTRRSAAEMIGPLFASISAQDGTFDANGHLLRFPTVASENSVSTLPCQTLVTNPDAGRIATCEGLGTALSTILGGRK